MTAHLRAVEPAEPGALATLVEILRAIGWADAARHDPYLAGIGGLMLEPVRPRGATGHTPARVAVSGGVLGLVTFDYWGAELDRCSWGHITTHNLERALDYITRATEESAAS